MLEQRPDMSLLKRGSARGMTLTELVVTTALGLIVVFGVTKVDVARTVMELSIHQQTASAQPGRFGAALASLKIAESLTRADRAVITGPDGNGLYTLQVRVSDCKGDETACGNWAERHQWEQFSVDTSTLPWTLVYYASDNHPATLLPCGKRRVLAQEITGLEFQFADEEPLTPLGGEPSFLPASSPANADNNMVHYAITWTSGTHTQTFKGQVMTRAWGYTDVEEGGLVDPRFGDPSPPALCSGPANTARTDRPCIAWTSSFGGWPCTLGGSGCFTDGSGATVCPPLCGIVVGIADRERVSYCVDVPPGITQLRFRSIYFDGAPQCGRYYHTFTAPEGSGAVTGTCAGDGINGGSGDCVYLHNNPPPGKWYINIIGDTPGGTCNDNSLIMGLELS